MNPRVTLITPVYNAMPYFQDYLACVAAQTWRPLEFICVDDGSQDGSMACVEQMTPELEQAGVSVRLIRRPHQNQAAAVNAALPYVTGEFLTWCDADDYLTPDSVEKKARFLLEHPELGMVRSDGTVVCDGQTTNSARAEDRACQNIFDALFCDLTYCYAGCYMLRSQLLFSCYPQRTIPLSPEGQNLQLLLPPASRSPCGFIPDKLHTYFRRPGGHSSQSRSFTQVLERIRNFTQLRLEVLTYCDCDQTQYAKKAAEIETARRKALYYSAAAQAREERMK